MRTEIGVIGLGVMGKSLSRNLARNGFSVSLFNRHVDGLEENVAVEFKRAYPELSTALAFDDLEKFTASLERPRKIILMVNAGPAIDSIIQAMSHTLEPGDVIIDGGNSHFEDTNRRIEQLKNDGLCFIGSGISGGEEGALNGPSIMPSGEKEAYQKVQKYLEAIAAKDANDQSCCAYIGEQGSGHFVKMIHNGIEYVEMQLLAECYAILKLQGWTNEAIATELEAWKSDLWSYLLEITVDILRKKEGDEYVLDKILDKAGNKGTGSWATMAIANSGQPATMIPTALFARYLSFYKEKRASMTKLFPNKLNIETISVAQLKEAYQFGRILNHHQGFTVIDQFSKQHNWNVNLSEIARIWTEGCIIKSKFMKRLVELFKTTDSMLTNSELIQTLQNSHLPIQSVVTGCIKNEIHVPCLLDAINYFHGMKTAQSPANLIQAQRDYFGAHTYQRVDDPSGVSHHTVW